MKTKTYHGLKREDLTEITSAKALDLGRIQPQTRSYLEKTLDTHEFYKGRMMEDGNETAETVLKGKYLGPGETGPLYIWHRLSDAMSSVEKTPELQEDRYYEFMEALDDFKLIPGGRIMHGGGREDINTTLNNCYVVAINGDSIVDIYKTLTDEAVTFKKGGGCGTNLSILRPQDTNIDGTGGVSCGPTGFMELYSVNTNTIAQHGRRGALMINLSSWHPDVSTFVEKKNDIEEQKQELEALVGKYPWEKKRIEKLRKDLEDRRDVRYANISVLLDHDFMNAVESDSEYELKFPDINSYSLSHDMKEFYDQNWDGDIERWKAAFKKGQEEGKVPKDQKAIRSHGKIKAKELWEQIIHNAHSSAEPGILFWDTMKDYHNLEYVSPLSSTNPCGEQPLPDGGCCNLAAVNLERMVSEDGKFDKELFQKMVKTGVRFLDNVIDYNVDRHALESQKDNARDDRRIGLGITGLADMLVKMGVKYDSDEGLRAVEEVMSLKLRTEYEESIELAKQKGSFPNYDWEGFRKSKFIQNLPEDIQEKIKENGIRNGTINTCAPVGSGAIIGEGSSGIEPIFMASYERDIINRTTNEKETFDVMHPTIEKLFGKGAKLPSYVVESHEIDPMFRVKMQGLIQRYTDTSISSTINLPKDVSEKRVGEIYMAAYKEGLKGVTVYVDGSRGGVLKTKGLEDEVTQKRAEHEAFSKLIEERINKPRPDNVIGTTEKVETAHGNIFLTLNYETSNEGELIGPYEAFATIGNSGQDITAFSEGSGRLLSRGIKSGIPVKSLAEQLRGIGGESQVGFGKNKVKSLPDAIAIGLENADEKIQRIYGEKNENKEEENKSKKKDIIYSGRICTNPNCGSAKVVEENGCFRCVTCGDSKCG